MKNIKAIWSRDFCVLLSNIFAHNNEIKHGDQEIIPLIR